ncbi:MAG: AbrB/MazE/SpoVT family DNA-binding domain-containing protein [Pyrinomonadaceae bacterium]
MGTLNSRIEPGNKIVLPPKILQELELEEGSNVEFRVEDGTVRILPTVHERVRRVQEKVKKYIRPGRSAVDELIADRRAEAERE